MRLLSLLLAFATYCAPLPAAQLAIIIDDIGYRQSDEAVLSLPANITLSVLPHTPLGQELARAAHIKGHEIMLHLPMQALNGKALGEGGLTNAMDEREVRTQLQHALDSVPYVKGVNNHMGSLLTQLELPMSWVMESLKQNQLYFVDSRTTRFSKAESIAERLSVPRLRREIFLDNDPRLGALEKQFGVVLAQAKEQGFLVVIAHPYPETVRFLRNNLTRLETEGIQLVPASWLLPIAMAKSQGTSPAARLK